MITLYLWSLWHNVVPTGSHVSSTSRLLAEIEWFYGELRADHQRSLSRYKLNTAALRSVHRPYTYTTLGSLPSLCTALHAEYNVVHPYSSGAVDRIGLNLPTRQDGSTDGWVFPDAEDEVCRAVILSVRRTNKRWSDSSCRIGRHERWFPGDIRVVFFLRTMRSVVRSRRTKSAVTSALRSPLQADERASLLPSWVCLRRRSSLLVVLRVFQFIAAQ